MKKRLFPLLFALLLLASCAGAPAGTWTPEETPEAREARILAAAEPLEVPEAEAAASGYPRETDRIRAYLCVLLTARDPELRDSFGGAFLDETQDTIVLYSTRNLWKSLGAAAHSPSRCYYLNELPAGFALKVALCDYSLAELGATARELEALALPGVLDVRVEPEQNRVAVYAERWDAKRQAELEEKLAHPEHCAVTLDAPPDGSAVCFAPTWAESEASPAADEAAAWGTLYRAMECLYNAWWYLPAGSWQRQVCDLNPQGQYQNGDGRHANLRVDLLDGGWQPSVLLCNLDYGFTPAWDEWGAEHEAFFRHLLAGLTITVAHYDEARNATVAL